MKSLVVMLFVVALTATGCASKAPPPRTEVMGDVADEVVVPGFQRFRRDVVTLQQDLDTLCREPRAAGAVERVAVATRRARASWRFTEPFWAGPVMERRTLNKVDAPAFEADVATALSRAPTPLTAEYVGSSVGSAARGLGAVDLIVTTGGANDESRCAYASAAVQVVEQEAGALLDAWTIDGGAEPPRRDQFAGRASQEDSTMALDDTVQSVVFLLRRMTRTELGAALGTITAPGNLDAIVEGAAGDGVDVLLARLDGIEAFLVGSATQGEPERNAPATSIAPLLGGALTDAVASDVAVARAALQRVDRPLREALTGDRPDVQAVADAITELERTVATEVVGRLGVTVGFSDADGDSAG